ncbi:MAG TPA: translocation/assembly module TamB domain-containing protein [Pyrinomonadaceae bacterium]|nr:translocation/assembly module TamB domain-containing protein [Pyrinomonadaceae bacterium]
MPVDERGRDTDAHEEPDEPGRPDAVKFTEAPEGAGPPPAPLTPKGRRARWRRVVNRRNAMWTAVVAVVAVLALALVVFVLYRTGRIDRIIAGQVVETFSRYGIRAEIGSFETELGPRTAELRDVKLYDAATGAQLGKIDRVLATVRIEDMYALSLRRHVDLEALEIDGLEVWVKFDEQGRSNFSNLRLPEPDPNSRILFAYSTANVKLNGGRIHYDDQLHDISGEAKNLRATIRPEDPNAPEESRMNVVELAFDDSNFVYDGKTVDRISVAARARLNQTRAEIQELVLRSPVTEARLEGVMDDWRALRYQMKVNATVDLTQTSDIFQPETTLRGTGAFAGTVSGEGDRYKVEGTITSDALAADGVRLKALNVSATGEGQGKTYEAQGRAVAELLTAGDFQLNSVQLAGGVMGTGTDFRWVGDLRAAAARSGQTSIAGLILSDAAAEVRGGEVVGTAGGARMTSIRQQDTLVGGVTAGGIRFRRDERGRVEATVANATAASVRDQDTTVSGARLSGIDAVINPDESALVTVERVALASVAGTKFRTGALNVAGVRLTVTPGGVVEGTTGDVNVGTADLGGGDRAEQVRLARPRFRLEPSGRYRASADLSLGGGVLGKMRLGSVRGALVATGEQIQLNDFVADIFNGRARGSATLATARGAQSRVTAAFEGVDVGGLVASATGRVVPLTGAATGTVDLRFPGENFRAASGTLDARFEGETGREEAGRTPLTGELNVRAERGDFRIERANLRTGASQLEATGSFSFGGDSNLAVRLNSSDASELQRVLVASGLAPEIEERLAQMGVELAGALTFDGTVRGSVEAPLVNGRFALASLRMRGRDLGSLAANVESDDAATRITDGRLEEPDGGGVRFTATIPRAGENNIAFDATLESANAANLLAALGNPLSTGGADAEQSSLFNPASLAGLGPASGRVSVTGYPGAMQGSADLNVARGTIGGEPYEELAARATFSGSKVNLETLNARLAGGSIGASGTVDIESQEFDLRARGENVRLDVVTALFNPRAPAGRALPALGGIADFTASAAGNLTDPRSYRVTVDARGRDVTVNGQPAGELSLVGRTTENNRFVLELTTGILGRPQVVRAEVDLASDALATTVETTLAGTDLTQLFATLLPEANVRVEGRATGSLRASGNLFDEEGAFTVGGLQGRAEFSELVVQIEDVPLAAENPLVVLFSTNEVTFERTRFTGPGTNILFGGTAALREGGRQNLTVDGSLNLRVLNRVSPNIFLSGAAQMSVRVAGTYADPRITGTAEVTGATFATLIEDERLQITNINGRVRFNANQAEIETLTGRAGGGRVSVSGGALLAGFRPAQYRLSVRGDDVTVPFPNNFRTTADAALEVSGTAEGQRIRGTVNVRRTEYTEDIDLADLIDRRREISLEEGGGVAGLGQTTLDLQIEGRDALVVRNNLVDMIGSISLRVSGPMDDPIIAGRVTATRGTLNFRNNRFEIQRAIIDLPPSRVADPVLNVSAEAEIRGYRVTAMPTGPLSQLSITLRSDPALPQADVVSLITTGDLASGDQSASILGQSGVGTATSLLTESLVNAPVRRATDKLFGLNRFEIDPLVSGRGGASPTARLTVGRQINRDLSVTYSTNVTGEPQQVVAVEYRLSDRMSFVARYQQGSQNTLRTQNNDFSFEIRFRKRF